MRLKEFRMHAENKYMHLLLVLLFILFYSPHMEGLHMKMPAVSLMFLVMLIFILRTLGLSRKIFYFVVTIGVLALAFEVATGICNMTQFGLWQLGVITWAVYGFFLAITIILMGHKMFSSTKVTGDTIMGGISVYCLIGFLWTIFYYLIYYFDTGAIHLSNQFSYTYLFYFSFVTLTTVGFGDIYPVSKTAMMFTSLEAIVGQLYLAIFVARLVGLHLLKHVQDKR